MENQQAKLDVLARLKNIKGHITGIERMVEENQPCANVLVQLSAIRASVEKVGIYILENNAVECLTNSQQSQEDKEKVEQVVKQILTFLK